MTNSPVEKLVPITSKAGVQRDGTPLESQYYTDAQWVRFQRGRPRKMGGMVNMSNGFTWPSRGVRGESRNGLYYVHSGSNGVLEQAQFDASGFGAGLIDRTPSGFTSSPNNMWQFDILYDAASSYARIIAHAAPNLLTLDSNATRPIYSGDAFGTGALTAIASSDVSGGVCVLHPYLFYYGSDGVVGWSVANTPTDLTGAGSGGARVTEGKVLMGIPTRGGSGNAPSGLFYATDSLVRCSFIGGAPVFNFDPIATGYSIMSSQCVVEYDGVHFWPGVDRFLYYNGVIREVPNDININFFFDNLNWTYRQKVFGIKNPRWGEIWWFYPTGTSTECNHVLIMNVREGTWYDTALSRTTGYYNNTFRYPIMFDTGFNSDNKTKLWQHEIGVDQVDGNNTNAIQSFFETQMYTSTFMGFLGGEVVREDINVNLKRIEPDFRNLIGNMDIKIIGRKYAQSPDQLLAEYTCNQLTDKIDARVQARTYRIRFESNQAGGDFQMGNPLMLVKRGDGRP